MKKLVSLLTAAILFCAVLVFPASAAGTGSISMGSASAKQGDSITLNVNMPSNPGLVTMTIKVSYDTNVLQLASVKDLGLIVGSQLNTNYASPYTIAWVDGSATTNNTKNGNIASFTFKVKDSAAVGKTTVKLEFVDSFDSNYGENTFTATSGTVTVACKTHNYGNYTKANNTNHTRTCSACGHIETTTHTWNGGTVSKTANCKEAGNTHYTCTATGCGATKDVAIAKTNNHTFGSWSQTSAPKCTTVGKEQRTCSICQKVETRDIKATGHSMGAWTQTKAPDCETKGQETQTCSKCSHKETRDIKATGHKFSNPTVTKQPTCTEAGIETGKCTVCGKETTNTVKATGHKMGEFVVKTEPTCTAEGVKEGVCETCGAKAEEKIPMTEHTYGEAVVTKEATETETGIKTKTCTVCKKSVEEIIPVIKAESSPSIQTDAEVDNAESDGVSPIIWIVIAVVLLGGAGAAFIIIKKNKK